MPAIWTPCLWCGGPIAPERAKDALLRKQLPKYCEEACRRNEPDRSLVGRILCAGPGDRAAFEKRLASAIAQPKKKKGDK